MKYIYVILFGIVSIYLSHSLVVANSLKKTPLEKTIEACQLLLGKGGEEAKKTKAEEYIDYARKMPEQENHPAAIFGFTMALESDPSKRLEILREYADQLSFNSQAFEAIPLYKEVIQANPSKENSIRAHIGLARAYDWTDQEEEALREYQVALTLDPTLDEAKLGIERMQAQIWAKFASKMALLGNHQEAIVWYRKALEMNPSLRGEILEDYADQLAYNSQADLAIPLYKEILLSNLTREQSITVHVALARAYNWTDQLENAIAEYQFVLTLDPKNREAIEGLEEVKIKQERARRKKEAADAYSRALCFEKRLEIFRAMEAFKKSLCLEPENCERQIYYAWFLQTYGFLEEAVAQLSYILIFSKDQRSIYQTLGWNFRTLGNLHQSFAAFSHVYPVACSKNTNYRFLHILKCQINENKKKEFDLIHRILSFKDWGAIQFPTNKMDSLFFCLVCKKDCRKFFPCRTIHSPEARNLRLLKKASYAFPPPTDKKKSELIKELLNIYSYTGNFRQARAMAQLLIWKDSEDYNSVLLFINALIIQKKYRCAISEYLLLIKKLPGNAFLYYRIGEAYEKLGLLCSAKLSYEYALFFDNNPRIQRAYTRVLAQLGHCQEAFNLANDICSEGEPFVTKTLSLAEMYAYCGCFQKASFYYRQILDCFPFYRPALFGLLQSSSYTGITADTHIAAHRIALLPFENWREGKIFHYYRPAQINYLLDYFKDNTGFSEFDTGITYDFYKRTNYRIRTDFIYSNYKRIHFEDINRYAAALHINKLCNSSELTFQIADHFYQNIQMPPDHISSEFLQWIMPTTSLRPLEVPETTSPPMQPILDQIKAIANSPTSFRHPKNSMNWYANYEHFWTHFNVDFGYRYYDVIDTVPIFNNKIFNYALQYGAVALNIKTQDVYASFFYAKDKVSLQGNVVYGKYSLNNHKQSRWIAAYYSLMNLPEVVLGYGYFFLNFTSHAPFFIENGFFERAYYDPRNFEVHTAELSTRFTPTNKIEYKVVGYLYYIPKARSMGQTVEMDFNYQFNQKTSLSLQFNYLNQNVSVGRDGLLDGYQAIYALLNLQYGF